RLKRLNFSVRNCSPTVSVIGVFLTTATLKFAIPGVRVSGSVRATLPNVNGAGRVNADVSNQRLRRGCAAPLSLALVAVLLGREPPPNELVLFTAVERLSGVPVWKAELPWKPHPETILPPTPVRLESIGWPLPSGRSRL